jgi:hypothetical protein
LRVPYGFPRLQFVYYSDSSFHECGRSSEVKVPNGNNAIAMACRTSPGEVPAKNCSVQCGRDAEVRWNSAPTPKSCVTNLPGQSNSCSGIGIVGPITSNVSYSASADWQSGIPLTASDNVSLSANGCPLISEPSVDLECAVDSSDNSHRTTCQIHSGARAVLKWNNEKVSNCVATSTPALSGWNGAKASSSGMSTVGPITQNYSPSMTCNGDDGSAITKNVRLTVVHNACDSSSGSPRCVAVAGAGTDACSSDSDCGADTSGCTFTASPDRLITPPRQSSVLAWTCRNVHDCSIDNGIGNVNISGTRNVSPLNSTTYNLSCTKDSGGAANYSANVTVRVYSFEGGALREILPQAPGSTTP